MTVLYDGLRQTQTAATGAIDVRPNNSPYNLDRDLDRRSADLALQHRLGLLSFGRSRLSPRNSSPPRATRAAMMLADD
jgi:hypothetical protein